MSETRKIAFKVEFSRILSLLADQIYQSPLALLRENTQNAFDAIRMRLHRGDAFNPRIDVEIAGDSIRVSDNGIGMSASEIENNFWYAGSSGKNNPEARAAGVVGTFGIGAMANFGIADRLSVESQSAVTGERTFSTVEKAALSTERPGIEMRPIDPLSEPGTVVTAHLDANTTVSPEKAAAYLRQFVEFVSVPIYLNGTLISGEPYESILPSARSNWEEAFTDQALGGLVSGDLRVIGMASGELRVVFTRGSVDGDAAEGVAVLIQGGNAVRTLRTGFGLATVAVSSLNQWGGVVDLPFLRPTAGREALEDTSNQQLQDVISALDRVVFEAASRHQESFQNEPFLRWLSKTRQYQLCGKLPVTVRPSGDEMTLDEAASSPGTLRYYAGHDQAIIATFSSDDERLIVLTRTSPRRECEMGFLDLKGIPPVDESPQVLREFELGSLEFSHTALATRVTRLLEEDYFLPADIKFGELSGDLPLLVTESGPPVVIYLDPSSTTISPLLAMFRDDFNVFGPFVKDFVRGHIFPRVAKLVPSSTREGAEAFLRRLQAKRELFEYDAADQRDLDEIWERYKAGELSLVEATDRMTDSQRSVIEVSRAGTASIDTVIGSAEKTELAAVVDSFEARPSIDRRAQHTAARILTCDPPMDGFACFLALSDRAQREKGDFFLQPHTTEVVWGGQKVVFIFQHHSQRFGLYYDVLCPGLVAETSGGGQFQTSTILTADRVFIPVPTSIAPIFVPTESDRIRLEIKCDVIYLATTAPT